MSVAKDQLNAAISAHATWKRRLNETIASGVSGYAPAVVATDNQCQFGKWLYNEIDPALKASPHYETIRAAHAEFHARASQILEMALSGNKEEAAKHMEFNSEFMGMSAALTNEIAVWRDSLSETV